MKENTFDIPGMNFVLLFPTNGRTNNYASLCKHYKKNPNSFMVIPLENIDGLPLETVLQISGNAKQCFFAIIVKTFNRNGDELRPFIRIKSFMDFDVELDMTERIEKYIAKCLEYFIEINGTVEDYELCFFERFLGMPYEESKKLFKGNK